MNLDRAQIEARLAALDAEIDELVYRRSEAQTKIDRLMKQTKPLHEALRSLDYADEQIKKADEAISG